MKHRFGGKNISRASPKLYISNPREVCEPKKRKFFLEIMC